MGRIPIDIPKSKKAEKLITKSWFLEKFMEYMLFIFLAAMFPIITISKFNSDLIKNEPIGLSLFLMILSLIFCGTLLYAIFNVYKLKRIRGLSRGQNSSLIKKIAEKHEWNISANNQQISIINFSWQNSGGTDWGKQMTIIYDKTDILVNCISFGLHSSPSPFHWFANKRKINKLRTEFEREINVLQQSISSNA